jgi:hypothetical protein
MLFDRDKDEDGRTSSPGLVSRIFSQFGSIFGKEQAQALEPGIYWLWR